MVRDGSGIRAAIRARRFCSRIAVAVCVTLAASPAWAIGDNFSLNSPALKVFSAVLVGGTWLICSPAAALLTWASARLVRVEEARYGRALLLTAAEAVLVALAMVFIPTGAPAQVRVLGAIPVAAAAVLAIAAGRRLLGTTWAKATGVCLLSWAMIAVVLTVLYFATGSR